MGKRSRYSRRRNVVNFAPRGARLFRSRSVILATIVAGAIGFSLTGGNSGLVHEGQPVLNTLEPAKMIAAAKAQPVPAQEILSGRASVIDGDTVDIGGTRVRFNGIDAPESDQLCRDANGKNYRCGQASAKALDAWLAKSRPISCLFVEWDRYGRFVGDCYRADNESVADWLVSAGHALDWPRHSNGAYVSHQAEAQAARRGIWQGEFQPPWEWRASKQTPKSAPQQAPKVETSNAPARLLSGSCDIKGNVSKKGERIYHVPGQRFYDETVITPSKGERMFCSEAEAKAAGWRPAKR